LNQNERRDQRDRKQASPFHRMRPPALADFVSGRERVGKKNLRFIEKRKTDLALPAKP
jgi:hypothetical protein